MLTERQKQILQIIIEDYIATAEPVGSRTIARKHGLGLSPATIRNEMSDLELLGYLEQPHTSAGRVPSAQAYRFYVDSLVEPGTLTDKDRALIDGWYQERKRDIDDIFRSTAKILSRMTKNVSMVLANKHSAANFKYLKFLPLDTGHAILCIVTDDGEMDNCVVNIPLGMRAEELDYLAGRISRMLAGRSMLAISEEDLDRAYLNVTKDKVLLSPLNSAIKKMAAESAEQKVFLGGAKQLLSQPEFRDVERVKDLLGILEEERVVKDLLAAGTDSGMCITIGSENKFSGIKDCSMVQATYRLNGEIVGTMAVLGPTRMEYGKVMAVMNYLHKYLEVILKNQD
ncbi:MAG: heat-inducible transcriptional repressor HrcA [Acidaminococcaceae bacterium]|jgi:heat-inducible transcriptional repressor|nr:heat-inducible transcriptional repressor HrcA [Acidaminococcaceae bacterium]